MAAAPNLPTTKVEDRNLNHLALIIIFGIFATTLPQPQVLGRLPLQLLLKDQLHVPKTQIAEFFFLCGMAWYLKPIAGILTDAFPIFRTRRRHYMLITSVLAAISWIAIIFVPRTYSSLLWAAIIINLFMVMMSTVTGAFLVEAGQSLGATGELRDHITVKAVKDDINQYADAMRQLEAEDIAAAILYAVTLPDRMNVNEILIRPTDQLR